MPKDVREPHVSTALGAYDRFPTYPLPDGQIQSGYAALAAIVAERVRTGARAIAIDGFAGIEWSGLRNQLAAALEPYRLALEWRDTASALLPEAEILEHIAEYLGGDDPLFGRLCESELIEFFDPDRLRALGRPQPDRAVIVYGVGAALATPPDVLVYVDLPKDALQQRMNAKTATNLGSDQASYKRSYFVDWVVLNRHKAELLPRIDWFVDGQNPAAPTLIAGDDLRRALQQMSETCFRARPWFSPGPWGGQWMKQHFPGLDPDALNYAWSFELITPENGLVLASADATLECSFDLLMFQNYREVLGQAADRFGYNFPIRFDYLDTIDGGNLSVQVHPRPEYIQQQFGEPFTQDESYYITTCAPGAQVYLGFRDGIDPDAFRQEVERSQREGDTIEIDQFVNHVEAQPHDLFLIPNGTIHGSGANNLVLEISATPYIYTFKIYDWMRRDLNGNLRPINIERAWQNLYFERQADYVAEQLCPQPAVIHEGAGWREVLVGTHEVLFYTVHRYEFEGEIAAQTDDRCHILNLVEGEAVSVETDYGYRAQFNFAETFVIPAAAKAYRLINAGEQPCKVVVAFVK